MALSGKTLCIIGANGYVGSHVAQQALTMGAKIISVSRSGRPPQKSGAWAQQVKWTQGNALHPEKFEDVLRESDAVVHTVATLFDSSIRQFKKPGEPGTYEEMNRDAAIALGSKLAELKDKKMIYFSASKSIPMIPRYLKTKLEAEDFLFSQKDLRVTAMRPGIIYAKDIPFRYALKFPTDIYASLFGAVYNRLPNSRLRDFLNNFDVDHAVDIKAVAVSTVIAAFDPKFDGKALHNDDMESLLKMYLTTGYKFPWQ
jgi:nucleoside-diphosphate-sugar epimerase